MQYLLTQTRSTAVNYRLQGRNEVTLNTGVATSKYQYISQPIYILADEQTFSAAKALTFILKNRQRATVIGTTTAGAGNIAGPYPLDNDFIVTIPVGMITDPLTKTGWEAVGIRPDIFSKEPLETAKTLIGNTKKKI